MFFHSPLEGEMYDGQLMELFVEYLDVQPRWKMMKKRLLLTLKEYLEYGLLYKTLVGFDF